MWGSSQYTYKSCVQSFTAVCSNVSRYWESSSKKISIFFCLKNGYIVLYHVLIIYEVFTWCPWFRETPLHHLWNITRHLQLSARWMKHAASFTSPSSNVNFLKSKLCSTYANRCLSMSNYTSHYLSQWLHKCSKYASISNPHVLGSTCSLDLRNWDLKQLRTNCKFVRFLYLYFRFLDVKTSHKFVIFLSTSKTLTQNHRYQIQLQKLVHMRFHYTTTFIYTTTHLRIRPQRHVHVVGKSLFRIMGPKTTYSDFGYGQCRQMLWCETVHQSL